MRWLAVTLALLLAAGLLTGSIYLRDRSPGNYQPRTPTLARADAITVLSTIQGWGRCARCAVVDVRPVQSGTWSARLRVRSTMRCVRIDIARFRFTTTHGFTGIQFIRCA
jgi:hypothetical protein